MGGGLLLATNDSTPPENWFRTLPRDLGRPDDDRLDALLAQHRAWLHEAETARVWPRPETARLYCQAVIEDLEAEIADRVLGPVPASAVAA